MEDQLPPGDLFTVTCLYFISVIYVYTIYLQVFICIIIGGFSLGQAAPEVENFLVGRGSASVIYRIIERVFVLPVLSLYVCNMYQVPAIDIRSPLGVKPDKIDQVVELKNVHFAYPARPDVPVRKWLGTMSTC